MSTKINLLGLDIYSRRIGFFYNNRERISSYCGLLLTFIYVVASLVLFIYYMIITTQRKEIRVYDSSLISQEMPVIDLNKNYFYFAFGLENPKTLNRFVDESIYIPEVVYIDRAKINGEFKTINRLTIPLEKCQEGTFGEDYQHLFVVGELSNSYCLKDFDYNLTFQGGFKYEKMSYVRIKIFPCINSTKNNNKCKPQEEIDKYLTSGYFSILLKDIGLNPSNYTYPVIPTLQNLYTTVDKRIYKNYILTYGLTEVQTDTGLFDEQITYGKYFQFRKELENFVFREEEEEYNSGNEIILVQIRLDDNILIQKRTYTKISEIFSRIGGYMQLMNTVFLLISLLMNKLDAELKILNSIFNFNIKEKKLTLKYRSLNSLYSSNESKLAKNIEINTSSKNKNSNSKDSEINENSNLYIILNNNKNQENQINKNKNLKTFEESKNIENSNIIKYKKEENVVSYQKDNLKKTNTKEEVNINKIPKGYINHLNLNSFDRLLKGKFFNKRRNVQLFNLSRVFYRKRMDIVISVSRSFLFEKLLLKDDFNKSYSIKEIEL